MPLNALFPQSNSLRLVTQTLGVVWLFSIAYKTLKHVASALRKPNLAKYKTSPDSWAFVTGSSGGIGLEVARELCRQGFNVVLHGTNVDKLRRLQETIEHEFPGRMTRSIALDVATAPISDLPNLILPTLHDINLSILVNMVGVGHNPDKDFRPFQSQPVEAVDRILNVNIAFTTHLTRLVLPLLTKDKTKPSLIINAGSLADIGLPWMSVYSGTKAYIVGFTRALDTELRGDGYSVDVLAMVIGDVDTPGHSVGTSFFVHSAETMGRVICNSAGLSEGNVVRIPSSRHGFQRWLCDIRSFRLLQAGMIANLKPKIPKAA